MLVITLNTDTFRGGSRQSSAIIPFYQLPETVTVPYSGQRRDKSLFFAPCGCNLEHKIISWEKWSNSILIAGDYKDAVNIQHCEFKITNQSPVLDIFFSDELGSLF